MNEKTATVPVKSAWWSKINWLQVTGMVLAGVIALVSGPALGLQPDVQVKVLGILNLIQSISTIVIKTYFTPTVISNSL